MADGEEYGTNGNQEYQQDTTEQTYEQPTYEDQGAGDNADDGTGEKINASKNDDDERKIFVGGLSWETTVKDLKDYFAKFGEVVDCTLKTDYHTGRSRGFGFVLFSSPEGVNQVCEQASHTLHGKNIDPKRAKARGGREPIKKVFVGGLDPDFPEADLREHFSTFGKIEEIDLPYDKMKGQRRAFCFITFESEEVVDKVCADPKMKLGAKEVDVKKATPRQDYQQGGFGARGGFGGERGGGFRGGRGGRGRGRGGGGGYSQGGYGQGGYGGYGGGSDYYNQGAYGGYDYNQGGYGGYGGYDYNSYYNQGNGWGGYGQSGYGSGGYGSYGGQSGQQQSGGYKAKPVGGSGGRGGGYHPYQR